MQLGERRRQPSSVDARQRQRARSSLGGDEPSPLLLEGIDTQPGGLLSIYFQYGDAEGIEKQVPVLDSRLPEYADLGDARDSAARDGDTRRHGERLSRGSRRCAPATPRSGSRARAR